MSGAEGQFRWELMGKPDYSQAAAYIASIPEETRRQLDNTDKELTQRILHLSWCFGVHSGRGAGYCWPTLATLARYCDRSVRTVTRHLRKLARLGLIVWRQRINRDGSHTSNLYQMGKTFFASLFARSWGKKLIKTGKTNLSTNNLKKGIEASPNKRQASIPASSEMKKRAGSPDTAPRGAVQAPAAPTQEVQDMANRGQIERKGPTMRELLGLDKREQKKVVEWDDEKTDAWQDDSQEDDRRAQLKRQAAWLKERGL